MGHPDILPKKQFFNSFEYHHFQSRILAYIDSIGCGAGVGVGSVVAIIICDGKTHPHAPVCKHKRWKLRQLPQILELLLIWYVEQVRQAPQVKLARRVKWVRPNFLYSPVTSMEGIRLILGLAARHNWRLSTFDVKNAYLNADLDEDRNCHRLFSFSVTGFSAGFPFPAFAWLSWILRTSQGSAIASKARSTSI